MEKDTKALRGFVMKVVKTLGRKDDKFLTFKKAIRLQGDKSISPLRKIIPSPLAGEGRIPNERSESLEFG